MGTVENLEVVTVFSMQQLGNSNLQTLAAMAWGHCPTTAEREWMVPLARMEPPPYRPAPPAKLTSVILALSAALPKQATDEMRGETMLAVYQRQLSDLTVEELEQSARKCLDELDWFPTIHQIKDRALNVSGQRIQTNEQIYHSRIRSILRNKPKEPDPEIAPLSPDEQRFAAEETSKILSELKAKAKGERANLT